MIARWVKVRPWCDDCRYKLIGYYVVVYVVRYVDHIACTAT